MTEFIVLLSLYYTCDALITHKPMMLTGPQLAQCGAHYDAVKAQFAEGPLPRRGTPEGVAARRQAYMAFKAWERENGAIVTELREQASDFVLENG